jgi:hypothetical protein
VDEAEASLRNNIETTANNPIPAVFTPLEALGNAMQYQMHVSNIPSNNPKNESSEVDMSNSS